MECKKWFKAHRAVTANYCDFSFQMKLPCQKITRTLVQPQGDFEILEMAFLLLKEYRRIPILNTEVPVYRPLREPEVLIIPYLTLAEGIDLSNYLPEDIQLGFTISAFKFESNRLILWHEIALEGSEC